jgi:cellulose synthase/poly-beta-1,6-N-acetylglucosamine synthase-like glycosyltransferase
MTILLIITILLFIIYAALLVYYRWAWQGIPMADDQNSMTDDRVSMTAGPIGSGEPTVNQNSMTDDRVSMTAGPSGSGQPTVNQNSMTDSRGSMTAGPSGSGEPTVNRQPSTFNEAQALTTNGQPLPNTHYPIPNTLITVIIPARNEAANIAHCLASILGQGYPPHLLQVIVADDFSTDNTAAIVQSHADRGVELLRLADHVGDRLNSYKKKAIELAVAQARGTLIVTTDADCTVPPHWLFAIATFYQKHRPAFIAAPVAIHPSPVGEGPGVRPRPIEIFQALDFMTLQGITGASVYKKIHTMCNGANLAYERSAFYEVGGFAGIDHIASGDDMLLMHKIYQRYPQRVLFLKSKNAIVHTEPVHSVKDFFNQRIRWASKADKYDDKRIFWVLVLVYVFNVMLLVLPVVSLFIDPKFQIPNSKFQITGIQVWLLLLCFKTLIELYFLYPVARFFGKTRLLWWFPLAQPFHILYTVIAGWLGKFGSYKWKGREVR